MSGLLGMLSGAARSLDAQRFGLDVVGQNIANVNTEGYSKRVADFSAVAPADKWTAGGGVNIDGVRSMRDRLIDRRVWAESSTAERESTLDDSMSVVDVAIGTVGESLDANLDEFFDSFATLADTPTAASARQEVLLQGQSLASAFTDMATRLSDAQTDADRRVRSTVEEVNELTAQIAKLNVEVSGTDASSAEGLHLRDQLNGAVGDLSKLVNINVVETEGGGYNIDFANGHPLVIGQFSYKVDVTDEAGTGFAKITSAGDDVTSMVTGGELGGLVDFRDVKVDDYLTRLNQLAVDVATKVNQVHAAGYGLNGSHLVNFFDIGTPPGASTLSVNPLFFSAGGGDLIAASSYQTIKGDNGNARLLAGIRDEKLASGLTASDAWSQLVYRVGRDRQAAADAGATQAEVLNQLRNLQDSVSGVSLDEEASDLMRFQRAYEANARFFSTVNDALTTLMNMVGA